MWIHKKYQFRKLLSCVFHRDLALGSISAFLQKTYIEYDFPAKKKTWPYKSRLYFLQLKGFWYFFTCRNLEQTHASVLNFWKFPTKLCLVRPLFKMHCTKHVFPNALRWCKYKTTSGHPPPKYLSYFKQRLYFYTPRKRQKIRSFLTFSEVEMEYYIETG